LPGDEHRRGHFQMLLQSLDELDSHIAIDKAMIERGGPKVTS
jgi:hypothetical protein